MYQSKFHFPSIEETKGKENGEYSNLLEKQDTNIHVRSHEKSLQDAAYQKGYLDATEKVEHIDSKKNNEVLNALSHFLINCNIAEEKEIKSTFINVFCRAMESAYCVLPTNYDAIFSKIFEEINTQFKGIGVVLYCSEEDYIVCKKTISEIVNSKNFQNKIEIQIDKGLTRKQFKVGYDKVIIEKDFVNLHDKIKKILTTNLNT